LEVIMANNESEKASHKSAGDGRVEMKIPASAEWVRVVRLATAGVAGRAGFSYDDVEDIKLAVAEACNNAILHSTSSPTQEAEEIPIVTIAWELLDDGLRISVSDTGRLEQPLALKPRSSLANHTVLEQLPESGLGLLLIESLMDEVQHESGPDADTTIHMTKRLVAPAEDGERLFSSGRPDPDSPVEQRTAPAQRTQTPTPAR
jgi:serine/threonine-protein kinase RsbW